MKKRYFIFLFFQLGLYYILSQSELFLQWVAYPIFRLYHNIFHTITNPIPFSIGDVLYILLGLYILKVVRVVFLTKDAKKRSRTFNRFMKRVNQLVFLYYFTWGFMYENQQLKSQYYSDDFTIEDLKASAHEEWERCIALRREIGPENKALDLDECTYQSAIIQSRALNSNDFVYPSQKEKRFNAKPSLFQPFLSYLGISGYYNPFTTEAQYQKKLPSTSRLFTLSHELSHQMGVAHEGEASFMGYKMCVTSKDKTLQYIGHYKALKYILRNMYPEDSVFVQEKMKQFSTGMQLDWDAERAYSDKHQGMFNDGFEKVNDAFLKANKQEGVSSYSTFVYYYMGDKIID